MLADGQVRLANNTHAYYHSLDAAYNSTDLRLAAERLNKAADLIDKINALDVVRDTVAEAEAAYDEDEILY